MPAFQSRDGGAGGGLRQVERLSGPSDVLALGHGDEDAELVQGHAAAWSPGTVGTIRQNLPAIRGWPEAD